MPQTTKSPAARRAAALTTASIASFSLTLLGSGIAVLAGLIPLEHLNAGQRTDVGALLLAVPVVALTLAIVFEATRLAMRPSLPDPRPRQVVRWSPGHREG